MAAPTEPPTQLEDELPLEPEYAPLRDEDVPASLNEDEGGWIQGGGDFEGGFDDTEWEAELEKHASGGPHGEDAWVADFSEPPSMRDEEVAIIKGTMASLDIAPPPWVRKMQHMQQIQRMQQQLQQPTQADDDVQTAQQQQLWSQQVHQRTPGSHFLPTDVVKDSTPLPPPSSHGMPGVAGFAGLGITPGPKRVSSRHLAAERRKARNQ